ncbi:pyridoxamine 5'-phosphate oxidase family protein [bacterium]|nr:pyridoxamine 5'-phosphate oxidase family protein [bacterium]
MRKKEKEITDIARIEAILQKADVCRLAFSDDNRPYLVPMCFGYENRTLYFHSATEGRKLDIIRKNPVVCFEVESGNEMMRSDEACSWSLKYSSVIGTGKADILDDPEDKRKALDVIMAHYSEKSFGYSDQALSRMVIIRVRIDSMTGKASE